MAGRGSPLRRLLGLETEYAIRYGADSDFDLALESDSPPADPSLPRPGAPGNDVIFQCLKGALGYLVATRPGHSAPGRDQVFLENGGALYYEYLPHCLWGGLVECATPECRGPGQLVLYQRAQESLLCQALPLAEAALKAEGFSGQLGLLKNSQDAEGHIYGSQENYEADIATGFSLFLYRCGLILLLPLLLAVTVITYLLVIGILLGTIVATIVMLFVPKWRDKLERISEDQRQLEMALGRFQLWFTLIVTWPITSFFARLLKLFAFRKIRRQIMAFLVTRSVLVGSGSVDEDRRFHLCEKAQAIKETIRMTIMPEDRPIFDTGNLIKMLAAPFNFQVKPIFALFRQKQRLQINLADSNRAQLAEYLKVGTASLMLDMIEDGFLKEAPQLSRPVDALHALVDDPTLEVPLDIVGGPAQTALEIQRFYLEQARDYLRQSKATSIEAEQVVKLWAETLDALDQGDTGRLVGRLDWVTKRFLLERCGAEDEEQMLKTLDLKYHELGEGYFDQLEKAGETFKIIDDAEAHEAKRDPPRDTPAFVRGGLIRQQAGSSTRVIVSWDSAYIGQRLRGKVIPFRPRSDQER